MNNLEKLKGKTDIIWDFDGTIARMDIDWTRWHDGVEKIFRKYDKNFVRDGKVHLLQNSMVKKYGRLLRDEICNFNWNYEKDNCKGIIANDKVIDYIRGNANKNYYIFTAQNHLLLDSLLKELDIKTLFTKIVTRDDVLFVKPDPEGINLILQGREVVDFIYLGDSALDEETAQAAGVAFEYISM